MSASEFTPALGKAAFTPAYDRAVRFWTREGRWRPLLLEQIELRDSETVLDVGCGTGTLAILLKRRAPGARVVGIDPDPAALTIAREKARRAGVEIEFVQGFARDAATVAGAGAFDKVVSSLVFHQVPVAEKRAGLASMLQALKPGGSLHIADYAEQHHPLMRALFLIIQVLDGFENTQANVDGVITAILRELGVNSPRPERVVATPTGAISLFRLSRP